MNVGSRTHRSSQSGWRLGLGSGNSSSNSNNNGSGNGNGNVSGNGDGNVSGNGDGARRVSPFRRFSSDDLLKPEILPIDHRQLFNLVIVWGI